jgi:hypothetical protein
MATQRERYRDHDERRQHRDHEPILPPNAHSGTVDVK